MTGFYPPFTTPPKPHNQQGAVRTVGFELEFSGINLADTVAAVVQATDGKAEEKSAAEVRVTTPLGEFNVEIDWDFLKRTAADIKPGQAIESWLQHLSDAAALLVPIEVVCPPIALDQISELNTLVSLLRKAGAVGTDESLIAAYGVHINPEIPALDADTVSRYLRAFVLLQWWLVEANSVDPSRRISPYIDLFSEDYCLHLLQQDNPTMASLIDDYMHFNPTRNRALDMLPLFAHIDEQRVRSKLDDPKIKARPTFHYRLPNCSIDSPRWSLAESWNLWCKVEKLAENRAALASLSRAFIAADRPLLGLDRAAWIEQVRQWLNDHA